jgi:streptogramin lyase
MTFNEGQFEGTVVTGSARNPACVPGALCWAGEAIIIRTPFLWVPATLEGQVRRYNVDTGAMAGPFDVGVNANWPSVDGTAPGSSPSRTAVNPFDSTVWVADREGRMGVAHLDFDGKMLCYGDVGGVPRAVATDAQGNAWVGSNSGQYFVKFSGSEYAPPENGRTPTPPRCKELLRVNVAGKPYGAASDNRNWIWIASRAGLIQAIDANTGSIVKSFDVSGSGCGPYGITADKDFVWIACYEGDRLARLNKDTGAVDVVSLGSTCSGPMSWCGPRGLAASTDGYVYVATDSSIDVARVDKANLAVARVQFPSVGHLDIISVAVDSAGRLWAIDYFGPVTRLSPGGALHSFGPTTGTRQYVYTDLTGQQTINAGLTPGLWRVVHDSGFAGARWLRLNLRTILPMGTSVSARVKVAASVAALSNESWWNGRVFPGGTADAYRPVDASGVIRLDDINLPPGRVIQVELKLTTASDTVTPVVQSLSATWAP